MHWHCEICFICSGMIFDLRLALEWKFRSGTRTGASSIRNDFTFVPEPCKHCALKCRVTKEGMEKLERAHSGLKLDPVSCKHTLSQLFFSWKFFFCNLRAEFLWKFLDFSFLRDVRVYVLRLDWMIKTFHKTLIGACLHGDRESQRFEEKKTKSCLLIIYIQS